MTQGYRVRFKVAYCGRDFSGWQIQPDRRTVQGELKRQLSFLLGREVVPVGAGRTDAGVHARGQVAHVTVASPEEVARLQRALPGLMPVDIQISQVEPVSLEFNSRFSAEARRYRYHLLFRRDIFQTANWQILKPVDRSAMDRAARDFLGRHDFTSFCKTASLKAAGNDCTVDLCSLEWRHDSAIFQVRANRFLHHMVRIMVGTLVEIGRGQRPSGEIPEILAARDRSRAGRMAPPEGLFLEEVYYPAFPVEGEGK